MTLQECQRIFEHGRLADIQEAMTRTEFYQFMQKGVKGMLADAYVAALAETTYQEITVVEESDSDKEDYPSIGAPALPRKKNEGMAYEVLNSGSPDKVSVTNITYGGILELTKEAEADDKTPAKSLRKQATQLGPNHARKKDKVFYSLVTANGTIYDAGNFFALNHPGYTGGAARGVNDNIYTAVTLSANAVATALGMIAQWEGADADQDLGIQAERFVVPTTLELTATALANSDVIAVAYAAGPLGPATTAAGAAMPWALKKKGLKVTASYRLDKTSVTDWYIKTSFPGLLHQPREGLTVVAEAANSGAAFERGVLRWRTDERYGAGVVNWRGMMLIS